ncbi:hypothetical protein EB796_021796 [Bugula neritina]|uniref:C2H2-type domain-containing protein n=1 Tax=Bugula neritina TaxID=10212 RepID=A0A7J7J2E6_BUGNE|nr:hypothetical protein EB796_021796 [Bugula neritina]
MNNHNGIKDFKCKFCDYKTADSSSLNRHMWRHKEEKPYSCRLCSFSCIQRTQMMAHYKNKHSLAAIDARKLITHINGPRTVAAHRIQTENQQTIEITDQTAQVVSSHHGAINIIGQDEGGNPIDIHLITEAAEGLLAASQIEIHTT